MRILGVLVALLCLLALANGMEKFNGEELHKIASKVKADLTCTECVLATDLARSLLLSNGSENDVADLLVKFCINFKIENESVCYGIVNMFRGEVFAILGSELSTASICGYFVDVCPHPNVTVKYNVTFPSPKPPHVPPTPPTPGGPSSIIMHISDVHFDELYVAGMNNDCGEPLCCRPVNGFGSGSTAAGKWGDLQCDLNQALLDNLLEFWENMNPKPDYVFWTGDNPPHAVWEQTREGQINNSAYLAQALKKALGDTPIFPAIGNHEAVPVNSYPLPPMNSWLYDALAEQWSVWLPEDAVQTFRYGGYYDTEMKPGFRVVSLNMNYCNDGNGWLLLNASDPAHMLEWLIGVLQGSESVGEKVYIIGHIPPGVHVCLPHWGTQFYQIVDRYEDTIIAQFYGHTHSDQFEVFYELMNSTGSAAPARATNVAYIAPSVTTYQNHNPSFRFYTIDDKSGYLTEVSTYHTNITATNENDNPEWVLEYNATSTYSLKHLFPTDWADLVERMEKDSHLVDQYVQYEYSLGSPNRHCDASCRKDAICGMRSGTSEQLHLCEYAQGLDPEELRKLTFC